MHNMQRGFLKGAMNRARPEVKNCSLSPEPSSDKDIGTWLCEKGIL
jgi:hypothetical protein